MAISYDELVASKSTRNSIRGWINWDLVPAEEILDEAQTFIYTTLRAREMETLASGTIAEGASELAMPTGFIQAQSFRKTGQYAGRIDILDTQHFEERLYLQDDGSMQEDIPTACMILGSPPVAKFNFQANADVPYRLVYYKALPDLASDNQTNFLTERYPLLLRAACLSFANMYQKNAEQASSWGSLASSLILEANSEADRQRQAQRVENYWET